MLKEKVSLVVYVKAIEVLMANKDKVLGFIEKIKPIQDKLNKTITKNENYATELVTNTGKRINYGNCIIDECSELLGSIDWKHWKHGKNDFDNLVLELVDILHFVASSLIVADNDPEEVTVDYEDILETLLSDFLQNIDESQDDKEMNHIDLLYTMNNKIVIYASILSDHYVRKTNLLEDNYLGVTTEMILQNIIIYHMLLTPDDISNESLDNTLKTFYSIYLAKNTLNKFRSDSGYADGTYSKIWSGVEDNVVALSIMKGNPELTMDELYLELVKVYYDVIPTH